MGPLSRNPQLAGRLESVRKANKTADKLSRTEQIMVIYCESSKYLNLNCLAATDP